RQLQRQADRRGEAGMGRGDLPHHAQGPTRAAAFQIGARPQGIKKQVTPQAAQGQISDLWNFTLTKFRLSEILHSPRDNRGGAEMCSMQYFVVMIDYGRRGREAIVDPEITRREVISRIASGEYRNICFIHEIADSSVADLTEELLAEAGLPQIEP